MAAREVLLHLLLDARLEGLGVAVLDRLARCQTHVLELFLQDKHSGQLSAEGGQQRLRGAAETRTMLQHSTQLQEDLQYSDRRKQSQYIFRHLLFLQLHATLLPAPLGAPAPLRDDDDGVVRMDSSRICGTHGDDGEGGGKGQRQSGAWWTYLWAHEGARRRRRRGGGTVRAATAGRESELPRRGRTVGALCDGARIRVLEVVAVLVVALVVLHPLAAVGIFCGSLVGCQWRQKNGAATGRLRWGRRLLPLRARLALAAAGGGRRGSRRRGGSQLVVR